jgi:GWxTD domain-containing protein
LLLLIRDYRFLSNWWRGLLLFPYLLQAYVLSGQSSEKPLARLDHALFANPGGSVYTEIYIRIPAESLQFKQIDKEHYQAKAVVRLTVSHEQNTHYRKQYLIKSPKLQDTSQVNFVLTDQRKVPLRQKGRHLLKFTVIDSFNLQNRATVQEPIVNKSRDLDQPLFSDVKRLDTIFPSEASSRFSEGSYNLRPMASTVVESSAEWLYFYAELYNAQMLKAEQETIPVYVTIINREDTLVRKEKRFKAKPVIKILSQLNTARLRRGRHKILVSTRAGEGSTLNTGLTVNVPYTDPSDTLSLKEKLAQQTTDTLLTYLKWMRTTARSHEASKMEVLEKDENRDSLIRFIAEFWEKRNKIEPKAAWQAYKADVNYVNEHYSNPLYKGYESDRGRVYLQYGAPNTIQRSRDDPNTYPYEIWHYFSTKRQSNIRFVFYSTSILETEFVLLHSNAIGEINNPRWQEQLNRNPLPGDDPFGNEPAWDYQK